MNEAGQRRWNSVPVHSCDSPYGLPFYPGEKVSVSLGWSNPRMWSEHSHPRLRLIFTFHNGSAKIETALDGIPREWSLLLGPKQLCVIPQEIETTMEWVEPAELVILYVDPGSFDVGDPDRFGCIAQNFQAIALSDSRFDLFTQELWRLCRQPQPPEWGIAQGLGLALATVVMTHAHGLIATKVRQRLELPRDALEKITEYIDARLIDGRISARDLAKQVSLSPDHFARRFKISVGMSPMQFVLKRRVEKAHKLLATGKYNVTEAAEEVGFYDLSHMNRCFRKFFGCSPKAVKNDSATDSYQ